MEFWTQSATIHSSTYVDQVYRVSFTTQYRLVELLYTSILSYASPVLQAYTLYCLLLLCSRPTYLLCTKVCISQGSCHACRLCVRTPCE